MHRLRDLVSKWICLYVNIFMCEWLNSSWSIGMRGLNVRCGRLVVVDHLSKIVSNVSLFVLSGFLWKLYQD